MKLEKADNSKQIAWIQAGYTMFANNGIVQIEPLAKAVGKSKSSFYHHFADIELFMEALLQLHITQSHIIAQKEKKAKNINPELIDILVTHKEDLLFNRQLRVHNNVPFYNDIICQSNKIIGEAFRWLWTKELNPKFTSSQIEVFFNLALDNFYMQTTAENLNHKWLVQYFDRIKESASKFA
jgi:AcrR family transcriptional regulator